MRVIHTAIEVSDLDATVEFYEGVLGLDHHWDFTHDGVVNYYVSAEDGAEIQFKHDPDSDEPVDPAGIDHLALSVDDVDATFDRVVTESDCSVVLEPTDIEAAGRRAGFVTDPDGYVVEFVQRVE
jgi:lactoylglutathione lyase